MRREGRVGGKPTNKTRVTGKCKRVGCRHCHNDPVNKSDGKSKGRAKRFAADKHTNPHLAEFLVEPLCKPARPSLAYDLLAKDEGWDPYNTEEGVAVAARDCKVFTISAMIDAALSNIRPFPEMDVEVGMDCFQDLEGEDVSETAIPDLEAFRTEFEVFQNAIDVASCQCCSSRVTQSDKSWSDVELSETEEKWEDDWSVVDEDV